MEFFFYFLIQNFTCPFQRQVAKVYKKKNNLMEVLNISFILIITEIIWNNDY